MAMPSSRSSWTLEMVHALPDDGNRYELIDGELFVTPGPSVSHQAASVRLWALLDAFTRSQGLMALCAPLTVRLAGRGEVQPDLVVFAHTPGALLPDALELAQLLLAVEILSSSTSHRDRGEKRELYQSFGVAEYWVVDQAAQTIERWRPNDSQPEVMLDLLLWQPATAGAVLRIDIPAFFRSVNG